MVELEQVENLVTASTHKNEWVPVNSIGKVSDSCIRDLGFNPLTPKTD